MNDNIRTRLEDVHGAATAINTWVQKYSYDEMVADLMIESAMILQFERIGEALRVVREFDPYFQEKLPDINQWVGLRHRLVHDYQEIDLELLWTSAVDEVPLLINAMNVLLEE